MNKQTKVVPIKKKEPKKAKKVLLQKQIAFYFLSPIQDGFEKTINIIETSM
jgi:hypothetical protein